MKPIVALVCLALLSAASPAGANHVTKADEAVYRDAFAAAEREDFARAHKIAANAKEPLPGKVIRWLDLTRPGTRADFAELTTFIDAHPEWPHAWSLRRRAEEAITVATPADAIRDWFDRHEPLTVDGMMAYGGALLQADRTAQAKKVLRRAWIEGSFGRVQERNFLGRHKGLLRPEDHVARLDRLLWNRQESAARRMLRKVDAGHQQLALARIALFNMAGGVDAAIRRVPKGLVDDPGLVYERARWRRQKDFDDGAFELLTHPSANKVRADLWWTERSILARRLLQKGHISRAYRLAREHGQTSGVGLAEAEWLAGWIALRFLDDRKVALKHFQRLFESVSTPISRARGAYWAGRAAESLKRPEEAKDWYGRAAAHVTTYYGQLAAEHLDQAQDWPLPADPLPTATDIEAFEGNELTRIARMLGEIGAAAHADAFLLRLGEIAATPGQRALAASLAAAVGRPEMAVKVARLADREGVPMVGSGYPLPGFEIEDAPEKALILALIRQESGFHHEAVSSAGARGLMQLLPSTARQVAKSIAVAYSPKRLSEPDYNVKLGSAYLGDLLNRFEGSYVLALAAYNAGPTRARRWLAEYGDPRGKEVDAVDWIETIPFSETRNYVQRVLESLQVYRRRLGATDFERSLLRDLKR